MDGQLMLFFRPGHRHQQTRILLPDIFTTQSQSSKTKRIPQIPEPLSKDRLQNGESCRPASAFDPTFLRALGQRTLILLSRRKVPARPRNSRIWKFNSSGQVESPVPADAKNPQIQLRLFEGYVSGARTRYKLEELRRIDYHHDCFWTGTLHFCQPMNRRLHSKPDAFSLVEVVVAIGLISFAMIAILAFFPNRALIKSFERSRNKSCSDRASDRGNNRFSMLHLQQGEVLRIDA